MVYFILPFTAAEQQRQTERKKTAENPWLIVCEKYADELALTEEMAHTLIERIEIDADSHVSVTLRFRDEYRTLIALLAENGEAVPV